MLPSLTASFLAGLVAGSLVPFFPFTLSGSLFCLAAAAWWCERCGLVDLRLGTGLYLAFLAGVLYWALAAPAPTRLDRVTQHHDRPAVALTGHVVAPVQHAPGRVVALIEPERPFFQTGRPADRSLLRLTWREPGGALYQGDRVEFQARLHPPSGSLNPGGFDYAAYLERQGVDAVATVTGADAVRTSEGTETPWRLRIWRRIDRWRSTIREAAIQTLPQPALGIFLGITIGERGYLQEEIQEWFMATGTVHLLSISGSHLGLVALGVFALVKRAVLRLPSDMLLALSRTVTPTRVAILCAWPVVAAYALLAGAELATLRSLVMITIALTAVWLGHERRLHHALAVAALLIVLHDPRAIFDISFQLSFLSVLAIVRLVSRRFLEQEPVDTGGSRWRNLARMGGEAWVVSGVVTVTTLPVVAAYFNQVPWLGIVTNLFAVPFTGFVLVPLGLLTAGWTILTGSEELSLGPVQARLIGWMAEMLRWCASLPMSEWRVAAPSLLSMGAFYPALALAAVRQAPRVLRLLGVTVVVMLLGWWLWSPRLGVDGDRWRVTFLDVGQGDSAVIELPDGRTVLIDGGARYERFDMGRGVVSPFLWNRSIRRIDDVIGTHQQLDHVGGLAWVLRHVPVGRYWGTGIERQEQFAISLKEALVNRRLEERVAVYGDELLGGGACRLTILNPIEAPHPPPSPVVSGDYLNNRSIVSRLQCGPHSILFSADIEVEGLRRLVGGGRQPVTVLKVPHHGARSSLDRGWLKEIRPRYAVMSVGPYNPYGHPAQTVLEAYAEEGVRLFRTDQDGAVWVTGRLSSSDIHLHRMRDLVLRPTEPEAGLWQGELENWRRVGHRSGDD